MESLNEQADAALYNNSQDRENECDVSDNIQEVNEMKPTQIVKVSKMTNVSAEQRHKQRMV